MSKHRIYSCDSHDSVPLAPWATRPEAHLRDGDITFQPIEAWENEPQGTCSSGYASALDTAATAQSPEHPSLGLDGPAPPITNLGDSNTHLPTASEQAYGRLEDERDRTSTFLGRASARHPSPTRTAEAPMAVDRRRKIAGFEQIAHGHLRKAGAPEIIELPASLVDALERAWRDSDAKQEETGGNVVRTYGGKYKLRRGGTGTEGLFEPDDHDVGWGETRVGIAHTHPYRKEGYDHGTFSSGDLVNIVDESEPLKLLRSGPLTYIIARTKEFDALVQRHEHEQRIDVLKRAMAKTYDDAFSAARGAFPDKLEASVIAVCKQFHLVYYEGRGAELHRVGGAAR